MPDETYEIRARWANRRETPQQCAERYVQTIDGLRKLDPVFGQWRQTPRVRPNATATFSKLPAGREELAVIFLRGQQYYDFPPDKPWPELGYRISAWNGMDEPFRCEMSVHAGAHWPLAFSRSNSIDVRCSRRRLEIGEAWRGSEMRDILRLFVEAWDVGEARVASARYRPDSPQNEMGKWLLPLDGWLTYLTAEQLQKVEPPAGVQVEKLANGGAILTLCEEPFTIDNPRHMKLAAALSAAMRPIQAYPSFGG